MLMEACTHEDSERIYAEAAKQIGSIYAGLLALGFISSMLSALVADNIDPSGQLLDVSIRQPHPAQQVDAVVIDSSITP